VAENWGNDVAVSVTATFQVAVSYTFPAGTTITTDDCVSVIASGFGVDESNVACTAGDAAAADADAADTDNTTTDGDADGEAATAGGRRLTAVVMDVQIDYDNAAGAAGGASAAGETSGLGFEVMPTVSAPVVTAEISFTVTSSEELDDVAADAIVTAVALQDITVTATEPVKAVVYERMPCVSGTVTTICPPSRSTLTSDASLACASEECTAADSETCCVHVPPMSAGGVRSARVLGSLTLLALSHKLFFF